MKYSDIIGIEPFFDSTFNITEEKENYWKQFIPNDKFEDNLFQIVNTFVTENADERKSIWVQGTYGTGKSHSTSVIKHLLSDNLSDVEDYINKLKNQQLKGMLKNFRKSEKVFPVVLKGTNEIVDVEEMKYVIQRETMKQLKAAGIDISVKSDFDAIISMLEDKRFDSFWSLELKGGLEKYASNKTELKEMLQAGDVDVLKEINSGLKKAKIMKATDNIYTWLAEVKREIKKQGYADYLVLFWDEFTSLLDIAERRSILNTIQDIAELSKAPDADNPGEYIGVYVFLVTHKNMEAMDSYKELKEDEKTMAKARFLELKYDMQDITTYHILSNAIKTKDDKKLKELVKERIDGNISIQDTLDNITEQFDKPAETKKTIKELYPFHPYTAYLATFVSRAIGSAERSIFEFLNDDKKGFKAFIEKDITDKSFLTADYVWDFFVEAFSEDRTNNFDAIINKFNMFIDIVDKKGDNCVRVFKTVLLFNLLNRVTATDSDYQEKSLVNPSEKCISAALSGALNNAEIAEALAYIDEKQIITRNPEGIFEISSSSMPIERVQRAKNELYSTYEDVSKIIVEYPTILNELGNQIRHTISRETEVNVFWGDSNSASMKSKVSKRFDKPFKLNVALCLFRGETKEFDQKFNRSENPIHKQKTMLDELSLQSECSNVAFVVIDAAMGNKAFEGFIENSAREQVAKSLGLEGEIADYREKAEKWVIEWKNRIISSSKCSIIFRGSRSDVAFAQAGNKIEGNVLPIVFSKGLDLIPGIRTSKTAWPDAFAKKTVENACFIETRSEFENQLKGAANPIKFLLKDKDGQFLFDEKLNYIKGNENDNPIRILFKEIEEKVEKLKSQTVVDLGKEFEYLSRPEYGYYPNYVCMAAVALAFRQYIGKIYNADQGSIIDKIAMKDIVVAMFTYWRQGKSNGKLRVRFSTSEEKELVDLLQNIFGVNGDGIIEVKWNIREKFAKDSKSPLWALKYVEEKGDEFNKIVDSLFSMVTNPNEGIKQDDINNLLNGLKLYKTDFVLAINNTKDSNCLLKFINKCLEKVHGENCDLERLMEFLTHELQEETVYWKEDEVKNKVLEGYIQQSNSSPEGRPSGEGMVIEDFEDEPDSSVESDDAIDEEDDPGLPPEFEPIDITPIHVTGKVRGTIDKVKETVSSSQITVEQAKKIFVELCEEYPVICDKLIKFLDKE